MTTCVIKKNTRLLIFLGICGADLATLSNSLIYDISHIVQDILKHC